MRIHEFGDPSVFHVDEIDAAVPGDGQVRISVAAVGVNFGDTMIRGGMAPFPVEFPALLGSEVVGLVDAVGVGVDRSLLGVRVASYAPFGGYAEQVLAPADALIRLPDRLTDGDATSLAVNVPTAGLVVRSAARIQPGETVVVTAAAGAIGLLTLQFARLAGASKIIGAVGSPDKFATVLNGGADHAVCYGQEGWWQELNSLTGGCGTDVVIDSVAGSVGEDALKSLAIGGRLIQSGLASRKPSLFATLSLLMKNLTVSAYSISRATVEAKAAIGREAVRYWEEGNLSLKAVHVFPLEQVAQAHALLESRQQRGKTVLLVGGTDGRTDA